MGPMSATRSHVLDSVMPREVWNSLFPMADTSSLDPVATFARSLPGASRLPLELKRPVVHQIRLVILEPLFDLIRADYTPTACPADLRHLCANTQAQSKQLCSITCLPVRKRHLLRTALDFAFVCRTWHADVEQLLKDILEKDGWRHCISDIDSRFVSQGNQWEVTVCNVLARVGRRGRAYDITPGSIINRREAGPRKERGSAEGAGFRREWTDAFDRLLTDAEVENRRSIQKIINETP